MRGQAYKALLTILLLLVVVFILSFQELCMIAKTRFERICLCLIIFSLLVMGACLASAHDHDRPDLDAWFNRLASGKGLCCSLADGKALQDVDWQSDRGHYRVRIDGTWYDVPEDAVITEPNRAGQTWVWPMYLDGQLSIRCFIPGPMT